jgi:hypothetical protein
MANSQEARRPSFQISLAKQAQKTTTKLGVPRGNCFNASKEKEFIYEIDVVDSKEYFETTTSKWRKIVEVMNANGYLPLPRNGATCKNKWGTIYGDF